MAARVEERRKDFSGEDLLLGDDFRGALLNVEAGLAWCSLSAFGRTPFRDPFLEAAVENRDLLRPEMVEHEPAPSRRPGRRIVIDDDPVAAADSEPLHRRSEVRGRGQHVRGRVRAVGNLVDVEEARAGNVRRQIFLAAAAPARRHVPAGIDDDEIRVLKVLREPFRGNERVHGARIGLRLRSC